MNPEGARDGRHARRTGPRRRCQAAGLVGAALLIAAGVTPAADDPASFTAAQRAQIEETVAAYLRAHPEAVLEALEKLERQRGDELRARVAEVGAETCQDAWLPHRGNPRGQRCLTVFYDHNCGYCKVMESLYLRLLQDDAQLQVVYVNVPMLSQSSLVSATVGQAIFRLDPEKYLRFHDLIMKERRSAATPEELKQLVGDCELDWEAVRAEIKSGRPGQDLERNLNYAKAVQLQGTPFLISGGRSFSGALTDYQQLRAWVYGQS